MRILLGESNAGWSRAMGEGLRNAGFAVDICATMAELLYLAATIGYAAVVVEPALDGDGALIGQLRACAPYIPILAVSVLGDLSHRLAGLDAGADDYMSKPVALDELVARLRALLRRPADADAAALSMGRLRFDPATRIALVGTAAIGLSAAQGAILACLLRRPGQALQAERLCAVLAECGHRTGMNGLHAHLSRLRRRLEQAGADVTVGLVPGAGYRLVRR